MIELGTLIERFDQVGRPMSDYYVVALVPGGFDVLDVKTGNVWPFSLVELAGFLDTPVGKCGRCAWRLVK